MTGSLFLLFQITWACTWSSPGWYLKGDVVSEWPFIVIFKGEGVEKLMTVEIT